MSSSHFPAWTSSSTVTPAEDSKNKNKDYIALGALAAVLLVIAAFAMSSGSKPAISMDADTHKLVSDMNKRFEEMKTMYNENVGLLKTAKQNGQVIDKNFDEALSGIKSTMAKTEESMKKISESQRNFESVKTELSSDIQKLRKYMLDQIEEQKKSSEAKTADLEKSLSKLREKAEKMLSDAESLNSRLLQSLETAKTEIDSKMQKEVNSLLATERKAIEKKISEASQSMLVAAKSEILAMAISKMNEELNEKIKQAVAQLVKQRQSDDLEKQIKHVLRALFQERIGRIDWLLEVNGASITNHSETFPACKNTSVFSYLKCSTSQQLNPKTFIHSDVAGLSMIDSPSMMLGNCWAMSGSQGFVEIRLSKLLRVTEAVIQHIPKRISPDIRSAPRGFRILGSLSGAETEEGSFKVLVEGEYEVREDASEEELLPHVQTFAVKNSPLVDTIRYEILSNQGKQEFTCLYHMRLHGEEATPMVSS
ncbi:hypothetical protein GUITHDRAFT_110573 [Guillardia theta CCMP2712]|uniref:SUN domain-containing protein n=1 Tax=Guillardia theta (strain CCMP2712) TaxID=905079 RepID=L1J5Q2_GUITC|nr:hypothetical protein GUITHDRAFT_110573 [Guillardia theta CCMP2712]EKX43449.1 hypothetical protein GUITHDRAFT_110573 [Guillardia theta CCMP2712]|eukprot:XP_005830429.1 hypothetical protein GUITHDRAFT_110573 [Guillardia theta CCMP2712]